MIEYSKPLNIFCLVLAVLNQLEKDVFYLFDDTYNYEYRHCDNGQVYSEF